MASRDLKRGNSRSSRPPPSRPGPFQSFFRLSFRQPAANRDENPQSPPRRSDSRSDRHQDANKNKNKDAEVGGRSREKHADRSSTRDSAREALKKITGVRVNVRDIDDNYTALDLAVKPGVEVSKLEPRIRAHSEGRRRHAIPETSTIRFYAAGRELAPDEVVDRHRLIYYRVLKARDKESTWKITHLYEWSGSRLDPDLVNEVIRHIDAGNTLGQLRSMLAKRMAIEDANRIVVTARDGLRQGMLQGDMWEVRQIKGWYCRRLAIDVCPVHAYVVVSGSGRRYIYHPPHPFPQKGVDVRHVKEWIEAKLLKNVHRLDDSKLRVDRSQINISRDGRRLSNIRVVIWGGTYQFELPRDMDEAFAAEEEWLLPANETCNVCSDDKKVTQLPVRITTACEHKPSICKDCLTQWIHSSMETLTWDRLKCPECPQLLKFDDVRRHASREDFSRYDVLATRDAVKSIPNFRWCLSTSCESGQIHDPTCQRFKCTACKAKHCVQHEVPWHTKETCEEYDKRNRRRRKEEKASEETIKKTTKSCPECKKAVHKFTGCNHITCVCGHEWCYVCFAPFRRTEHDFLFCRHNPGCTERDPFVDLVDPEGRPRAQHHANGRRAWPEGIFGGQRNPWIGPALRAPLNRPPPPPPGAQRPHRQDMPQMLPPHFQLPRFTPNGVVWDEGDAHAGRHSPPPPPRDEQPPPPRNPFDLMDDEQGELQDPWRDHHRRPHRRREGFGRDFEDIGVIRRDFPMLVGAMAAAAVRARRGNRDAAQDNAHAHLFDLEREFVEMQLQRLNEGRMARWRDQ